SGLQCHDCSALRLWQFDPGRCCTASTARGLHPLGIPVQIRLWRPLPIPHWPKTAHILHSNPAHFAVLGGPIPRSRCLPCPFLPACTNKSVPMPWHPVPVLGLLPREEDCPARSSVFPGYGSYSNRIPLPPQK